MSTPASTIRKAFEFWINPCQSLSLIDALSAFCIGRTDHVVADSLLTFGSVS